MFLLPLFQGLPKPVRVKQKTNKKKQKEMKNN
jgi:hypothetical protein